MRLKGLAQAETDLRALCDSISEKIDDLYDEPPQWEEKDEFFNAMWDNLDQAADLVKETLEAKLEDWL